VVEVTVVAEGGTLVGTVLMGEEYWEKREGEGAITLSGCGTSLALLGYGGG
jgi:hypothetical protein